jgi:F-type H+-transporting ATPase subunit delta
LDLATEQNSVEPVSRELQDLRQVILENPTFKAFLSDPSIGEDERDATLKKVFGGKLQQLLMNFLGVLNTKRRLGILDQIIDSYEALLDERHGKIEVDVTVAERLSGEQLEEVRQRISAALSKDAVVHQYVDDSIIGGVILRVGDKLIDASVRYQLRAIKEQLLAAGRK